jgi:hypothetical protein
MTGEGPIGLSTPSHDAIAILQLSAGEGHTAHDSVLHMGNSPTPADTPPVYVAWWCLQEMPCMSSWLAAVK